MHKSHTISSDSPAPLYMLLRSLHFNNSLHIPIDKLCITLTKSPFVFICNSFFSLINKIQQRN